MSKRPLWQQEGWESEQAMLAYRNCLDGYVLVTLQALYAKRDVQGAAEYLASLHGVEQQNAMDIAVEVGFVPEFYVNTIRVTIPQL